MQNQIKKGDPEQLDVCRLATNSIALVLWLLGHLLKTFFSVATQAGGLEDGRIGGRIVFKVPVLSI